MEHNPMKYWKKNISLCFYLCFASLIFLHSSTLLAQGQLPVREYTNPDELVTLGSETTFSQTFMILGGFSRRFTDKVLIDRSGKSGPIGFNIPSMHWRQALDYIANAHNLALQEQPDYIEIIAAPVRTSSGQAATVTTSGPIVPPLATLDTREIEISAIFFEGNRRQLREIGVDWSAVKDGVVRASNFAANSVSLNIFQVEMPPQTISGGYEISAFLSALELLNVGEILSTPRIKVMDGKEGDIQVGQDFSIKQRDFAGNVTDAFYSTGTILTVTPTIITDSDTSFIFLNIKAERSTATPDPVSTIINKQEAVTQVLLYSGESTVIAGLYETEESEVRRGIPLLKDLPPWFLGLRYLFGFNSIEYTQKELIIVIKAELVPSLRERFNQERDSKLNILQDGRRRLIEDTVGNQ
jgi:general secretion pathway protein D